MKKLHILTFTLILSLIIPLAVFAKPYKTIYVIGDSLSDQGNLFQATLALTGSGRPATDHYHLGRFSNGECYAGLLAEKIGITLSATSNGGTNFAYGGSRTNYNIVESPPSPGGFPPGLYPWTLNLQRQTFADRGIHDTQALFVVFSGSNDIADLIGLTLKLGFEATKPASEGVVAGVKKAIEAYIAAGARDIIVPNIPDMGLVPSVFGRDPLPGFPPGSTLVADTATALTIRYNAALDEMLKGFQGVNIVRFDTFSFFREIVKNPSAFGLTNVSAACYSGFVDPAGSADTVCNTQETYLFWDREHPTTSMHAILAKQMMVTLRTAVLADLGRQVGSLALHNGIDTALQSKLVTANKLLADTNDVNDVSVVQLLQAFIAMVEAQRGIHIPADQADALVERARQIIELQEAIARDA